MFCFLVIARVERAVKDGGGGDTVGVGWDGDGGRVEGSVRIRRQTRFCDCHDYEAFASGGSYGRGM